VRLKVWQVGEMVLRQAARSLARDEILDRGVQDLIVSMRETTHDAPGVGLAAPQVGVPVQLVMSLSLSKIGWSRFRRLRPSRR